MVEITHQGRARELARDFTGRAAHIDVDDVGAQFLGHAGPFCHPARFATRQLDDEGSKIPANCPLARSVALTDQMLAGHHLGHHEPRAQRMGKAAEG